MKWKHDNKLQVTQNPSINETRIIHKSETANPNRNVSYTWKTKKHTEKTHKDKHTDNHREWVLPKGQMKSEHIYEIIDFKKYHQKNLIDFCPERLFRLGMLCTRLSRVRLRIIERSHMYLVKFFLWYFGKLMIS